MGNLWTAPVPMESLWTALRAPAARGQRAPPGCLPTFFPQDPRAHRPCGPAHRFPTPSGLVGSRLVPGHAAHSLEELSAAFLSSRKRAMIRPPTRSGVALTWTDRLGVAVAVGLRLPPAFSPTKRLLKPTYRKRWTQLPYGIEPTRSFLAFLTARARMVFFFRDSR